MVCESFIVYKRNKKIYYTAIPTTIMNHRVLVVCVIGIVLLLVPQGRAQDANATAFTEEEPAFGFWVSTVECKDANAKPIFSFNKVMRCGCAVGTSYVGPCYDLGQEVLGLKKADVERLAKEMQEASPAPTPVEQCQTIPRVFLDSGTGDSGANFDELYDAAMNSACNQEEFEWRARDCRDSFIPGKGAEGFTGVQDRSVPYCTIECESLFLKIAENCPRVYELLNLGQFSDLCPSLKTVQIATRPVGVAPVVEPIVVEPPAAVVIAEPPAPVVIAEPPAPVVIAEPPAPVVFEPPVVVVAAPPPSPAAAAVGRSVMAHVGVALAVLLAL